MSGEISVYAFGDRLRNLVKLIGAGRSIIDYFDLVSALDFLQELKAYTPQIERAATPLVSVLDFLQRLKELKANLGEWNSDLGLKHNIGELLAMLKYLALITKTDVDDKLIEMADKLWDTADDFVVPIIRRMLEQPSDVAVLSVSRMTESERQYAEAQGLDIGLLLTLIASLLEFFRG